MLGSRDSASWTYYQFSPVEALSRVRSAEDTSVKFMWLFRTPVLFTLANKYTPSKEYMNKKRTNINPT